MFNYFMVFLVSLFSLSSAFKPGQCGSSLTSEEITNGTHVSSSRFPWVAFITFDSSWVNTFVGAFSQKIERCEAVFVSKTALQFRQDCIATGWKKDLMVRISTGSTIPMKVEGKNISYLSSMEKKIQDIKCQNGVCLLQFEEPQLFASFTIPICVPSKAEMKRPPKATAMVKVHFHTREVFGDKALYLIEDSLNPDYVENHFAGKHGRDTDESKFRVGDIIMYEHKGNWYLKGFVSERGLFKKSKHLINFEKP